MNSASRAGTVLDELDDAAPPVGIVLDDPPAPRLEKCCPPLTPPVHSLSEPEAVVSPALFVVCVSSRKSMSGPMTGNPLLTEFELLVRTGFVRICSGSVSESMSEVEAFDGGASVTFDALLFTSLSLLIFKLMNLFRSR